MKIVLLPPVEKWSKNGTMQTQNLVAPLNMSDILSNFNYFSPIIERNDHFQAKKWVKIKKQPKIKIKVPSFHNCKIYRTFLCFRL